VDHLEVRVPSNVSVGSPFTVTTTARDAAGNAVPSFAPTDGTWSELFDGGGSLGAFVKGVSKTSVTLPYPEHQIHLFVAAGGLQGTSNPYNIVGPLDHIETAWTRTDGQTGCRSMMTGKLVMKAVDSLGQVIPTYNETGMTWIEGVGGLSALDPSAPAPFVKGVSSNPSVVLNYQILGVNVSLPDSDYIEVDKASGLPEAFAWVC
jgi:hypothetical protein